MFIQNPRLLSLLLIIFISAISLDVKAKSTYKNQSDLQTANAIPNVIIIKFSGDNQFSNNTIQSNNAMLNKRLNDSGIYSLRPVLRSNSSNLNKSIPTPLNNVYYAYFRGDQSPSALVKQISQWPDVVYAEPKRYHYISQDIPNDTLYSFQSGYYEVIKAPQAWDQVKGDLGVIIAIVDGGTQIAHSDLSDNIWRNTAEVQGNPGVDDDDNGYIDDLYGWNFTNQTGDPTGLIDTPFNADHGTHTAGIAAAVTDNINGVAGVSWNTTVMGINAADESSDRFIAYGFEGIIYAAENGADIISCSWGALGGYSQFEQEVVNYATSLGSIVIAAAGNNSSDLAHYPSSYENVLSIASTTVNDEKYILSNYGNDIDLAAPGVNIYSTFNQNRYGFATGTSMSAPMASGVAALVKALNPDWNGLQLGEQIRVTADSLPQEAGRLGKGRLNAFRAVTETFPSIRLISYDFEDESGNGVIEPGERVNIYISLQNFLEPASNVELLLTSSDPNVTISQGQISVPSISTLEKITLDVPFVCDIAENAPSDHIIEFVLEITSTNYEDIDHLSLIILPGFLNLGINNVNMTVTSLGRVVHPELLETQQAVGFSYKFTENLLFEGAVISGTSATQISNAARSGGGTYDKDFVVSTGGEIMSQNPGILSDEESIGKYVDQDAANPMNIEISQYTHAWNDSVNNDYIIIRFDIYNQNSADLNNFHFGWYFDWDIDGENFDTNIIGYDTERKMGYAYDSGEGPETYVGVVSLGNEGVNFEAIYNEELTSFTDSRKWESISSGIISERAGPADVSFVIANGPIVLPAYSHQKLAFAMVAGDDSVSLLKHADSAIAKWEELKVLDLEGYDKSQVPKDFFLLQNYPNPFNPKTIINYELPITNYVEVSIYNLLGQKITTLISEEQQAGKYSVEWDASGLASGVYYYELRTDYYRNVKKMVFMK